MEKVIWKGTLEEAEEKEIEEYAFARWDETAKVVENMRKMFWHKEYSLNNGVELVTCQYNIQDLTDDFE